MPSAVPAGMFSSSEIRKHRDTIAEFCDAAADFLDWVFADHKAFYAKWGVSKYYGNRKPEHRTRELRIKELKKFGKPTFLVDQQVSTACILLAMQAVERGFNATDMPNTWKKINNQLKIDQKSSAPICKSCCSNSGGRFTTGTRIRRRMRNGTLRISSSIR